MNSTKSSQNIYAISPLDGRYLNKLNGLEDFVSEAALIKYRLLVEIEWLLHLNTNNQIAKELSLSTQIMTNLNKLRADLLDYSKKQIKIVTAIKKIEQTTKHDVKAVEYYLQNELKSWGANNATLAHVHFACTSEDINNLAYSLMLSHHRSYRLIPKLSQITDNLKMKAKEYAKLPMLARTHGQPASPTTLGKEFAVFYNRAKRQLQSIKTHIFEAKINGAVGNFNAHYTSYPDIDWPNFCKDFIESKLDLKQNNYTTQIENHDNLVEFTDKIRRTNVILIDLVQDLWGYIAHSYFKLKVVANEVGSSTMPHKVNPIDFENSEGNLGLTVSLCEFFARKLPISRYQRDLSDSTSLRSLATLLGHTELAYSSLLVGLDKIIANESRIDQDIENCFEILAEPIQMLMRRYAVPDAYERLKAVTRGQNITLESLHKLIDSTPELPEPEKIRLKKLKPSTYIGIAVRLAEGEFFED